MLSLEVQEFAQKIKQLSVEDKRWLFQQLSQEISFSKLPESTKFNTLVTNKKPFNITPAESGSGADDTAINHDQIFVNSLLNE